MSAERINGIRALLKGIETGDPAAVAVVNEAKYIQHNPQTHEGSEGLAALFQRISKSSPRVNVVRMFSDGDFVFGHTEYDFSTRRIGFEVFRFDGDQAVEHWDNIQPRLGPNESGHSMVDGPSEVSEPAATEETREIVQRFVQQVLVDGRVEELGRFVNESFVEHNPALCDGLESLRSHLESGSEGAGAATVNYQTAHRLLVQGEFALSVCEGFRAGVHTSFYDLFRVSGGQIVEHWDTVESVPPKSEWKNDNGKF